MNEDEVIIGKKLSPASLPTVENFSEHESNQVLVIRKYLNGMTRSLEIMAPMSHRFNNCEHFEIRSTIIAFCWYALTGKEGDRVPLITMKLTDDARDSKTGCISVKTYGKVWIKVTENRSGSKTVFEFVKGLLSLRGPIELLILAKERRNRSGYTRVSFDKTTIKVCEA